MNLGYCNLRGCAKAIPGVPRRATLCCITFRGQDSQTHPVWKLMLALCPTQVSLLCGPQGLASHIAKEFVA